VTRGQVDGGERVHYRFSISNGDCPYWFRQNRFIRPVRESQNMGGVFTTQIIAMMSFFFFHLVPFEIDREIEDRASFFSPFERGRAARLKATHGINVGDQKRKK